MSKERRQQLFDKYPELFEKKNVQPTSVHKYPIYWGLEHGDGWIPIVEDLCNLIQQHVNHKRMKDPNSPQPQVFQVKEKYGSLRFYINHGDDYIYGLIAMAESVSARTCEECGVPGKFYKNGWLRVRCDPCEANRAEEWKRNHDRLEAQDAT